MQNFIPGQTPAIKINRRTKAIGAKPKKKIKRTKTQMFIRFFQKHTNAKLVIVYAFGVFTIMSTGIFSEWTLQNLAPISASASIDLHRPEVKPEDKPKEPSMEEWVMAEVKSAGLSEYEAWAIINTESKWNDQAIGVNTNKTVDLGLWQGNSIHIKSGATTAKCLLDYKCATKWAIEKRLHDGNWSAWVGANKLGIK